MNFNGLLIGLFTFLITGTFHSLIVKGEHVFSNKIWPLFLAAGLIFLVLSLFLPNQTVSSLAGVLSFTCFWSTGELKEQEERVKKG